MKPRLVLDILHSNWQILFITVYDFMFGSMILKHSFNKRCHGQKIDVTEQQNQLKQAFNRDLRCVQGKIGLVSSAKKTGTNVNTNLLNKNDRTPITARLRYIDSPEDFFLPAQVSRLQMDRARNVRLKNSNALCRLHSLR